MLRDDFVRVGSKFLVSPKVFLSVIAVAMRTLMLSTRALALSSFVLMQMRIDADARSRTKTRGATVSSMQNATG